MKKGMKLIVLVGGLTAILLAPATGEVIWGYETFVDRGDGQISEWGWYNLSVVPDNDGFAPESLAVATIQSNDSWGVMYYGTGIGSGQIPTYRYLYLETYDVQGNMRLQIAGPGDADNYDVTSFCLAGDPGHLNVIYNPGAYVFDMSGWLPSVSHDNVSIKLIGEGGEGNGFTVNRMFFTDNMADTGFEVVPEPTSVALMIGGGLSMLLVLKNRRKRA